MTKALNEALERLSLTQRQAVEWEEGAALVLAGPGVGKTTVLTARIARILESSRNRNFRILALTFTTKAGDEMRSRVDELVPGLSERTVIGTFHAFCAQVLRQHGSHLGIKPDFAVYDQDSDREELLKDALRAAAEKGQSVSSDEVRWLRTIDRLRSNLVSPAKTAGHFRDEEMGLRASLVYSIYEEALRARNIMDFNGLILDTCRLAHQMPAVAARIRQSYPYWMIDEFQDTSPAQFRLVRFLAGDDFRNVFAVADDDQIIYQWAGASYRQIVAFRDRFKPELFQLVENRRCPPAVVQIANNLIAFNSDRTPGKAPLLATKPDDGPAIHFRTYGTEADEATGIAAEIAEAGLKTWPHTAVLGRTRAILTPVVEALRTAGVKAAIVTRRDRFISPQFVWLQACLDQGLRPTDRQVFIAMTNAANLIAGIELDASLLEAEAEGAGHSLLEHWAHAASGLGNDIAGKLAQFAYRLVQTRSSWRSLVAEALVWLPETAASSEGVESDAADDKAAWEIATRAIRAEKGGDPDLAELLQGIALRPKEPPPDPDSVRLFTIHSAKGLEFEQVWVMGMAETVLPSWQSLQPKASPAELEEERRNCFVAITRTKRTLTLTRAEKYRGWVKKPSRFLEEMKLPEEIQR
ncbi:DNA helicase-2 / ATP-dependent DNA helicase PcrA [Enhydrobacter aerosaccus]|uniref:DNA 3'-5' helicase n=1 Tax=Enhydrobacter aerosaccus TaxID=225324 RepID=A0A1T4S8V1_9HYPH|nr:ATP-dependent helicase [Enhydrobacter aerosaccus]SKA24730.1 DNA helicase-2 / ATP-dependent DNA helicase PcrA [Enhydrobacter aerosaccus]